MRILVIAPLVHLETMPTGTEPIRLLAENGDEVDVLTLQNPAHLPFMSTHPKCRVKLIPFPENDLGKLISFLIKMPLALRASRFSNIKYDVVWAISQLGLIYAWWYYHSSRIPVIYMSDEICFGNEGRNAVIKLYRRALKWLETRANQRVAFTIIQDEERAELLAKTNRIDRASIMILPNAMAGKSQRFESRHLQGRFGLPESDIILLQVGVVSRYFRSLELVRAARGWPGNYKLIFHSRCNQRNEAYFQRVQSEADRLRTFFSLNPVSFSELDQLIGSAHIGLALMEDFGNPNVNCMGKSSGKIASFLKNGLPVIAQDFPSLRWVEQEGCGVCISSVNEVIYAAQLILENYQTYSENSMRTYDNLLSIDGYFQRIRTKLEAVTGRIEEKRHAF